MVKQIIMRIRAVIILLVQISLSIWAALYAVFHSVTYLGLPPVGPVAWWRRILPWPLHSLMSLTGFSVGTAMLVLFGLYSGMLFLILRYAIVNPIMRSQSN